MAKTKTNFEYYDYLGFTICLLLVELVHRVRVFHARGNIRKLQCYILLYQTQARTETSQD